MDDLCEAHKGLLEVYGPALAITPTSDSDDGAPFLNRMSPEDLLFAVFLSEAKLAAYCKAEQEFSECLQHSISHPPGRVRFSERLF